MEIAYFWWMSKNKIKLLSLYLSFKRGGSLTKLINSNINKN